MKRESDRRWWFILAVSMLLVWLCEPSWQTTLWDEFDESGLPVALPSEGAQERDDMADFENDLDAVGDLWTEFQKELAQDLQRFRGWQHCYDDESDSLNAQRRQQLHIAGAHVTVQPSADGRDLVGELTVDLEVAAGQEPNSLALVPEGSFYTIEYWHQESGAKIKYRGPYDACTGWLGGRSCPLVSSAEKQTMQTKTSRTLLKGAGVYEVTLQLWAPDCPEEELLCLVVPFVAEDPTQQQADSHYTTRIKNEPSSPEEEEQEATKQQQKHLLLA